jgi:hypothetical protein
LRFFTPEGELVPIPQEAALNEQEQRELAEQRLASNGSSENWLNSSLKPNDSNGKN